MMRLCIGFDTDGIGSCFVVRMHEGLNWYGVGIRIPPLCDGLGIKPLIVGRGYSECYRKSYFLFYILGVRFALC